MDPPPRGAAAPPDDPDGGSVKFGAYSTEVDDMVAARAPFAGRVADWQQTVEASVMDTADDIAYAIHDLEDVHRVGVLQQGAVAAELMAWQRWGRGHRPDDRAGGARSSRCAGSCTARTAGWPTTTRSRPRSSWSAPSWWTACWPRRSTARSRRRRGWRRSRRPGPAGWSTPIEVAGQPAVRSGHVQLAPAQWHEVQILKFVQNRFVLARPDLALHQRGQARLLASLVEALLAWLTDPDEEERLPRRLRDLVELAEAELPRGHAGPDRPGPRPGGVDFTWGQRIINGANGIKATSKEATIYSGATSSPSPSRSTSPSASASPSRSVSASPSRSASASPSPSRSASASPSPSRSASASPSTGGSKSCTATYSITGQWPSGFQGDVKVAAGAAPITAWAVTWTFANGQTVTQSWSTTLTSSGASVTARNVSYNGALAAGASTNFGFLGSWNNTTNAVPTLSCTAS